MLRGFLNVDYEDGEQSTYKALEVSVDGGEDKIFDSGDITIDYIDYIHWIAEGCTVAYSSSWDHFFMDGDKYKTLYVDHSNDENKVITKFNTLSISDINRLMQYPVTKNITTFEQLRKYYRSKRPKDGKTSK